MAPTAEATRAAGPSGVRRINLLSDQTPKRAARAPNPGNLQLPEPLHRRRPDLRLPRPTYSEQQRG